MHPPGPWRRPRARRADGTRDRNQRKSNRNRGDPRERRRSAQNALTPKTEALGQEDGPPDIVHAAGKHRRRRVPFFRRRFGRRPARQMPLPTRRTGRGGIPLRRGRGIWTKTGYSMRPPRLRGPCGSGFRFLPAAHSPPPANAPFPARSRVPPLPPPRGRGSKRRSTPG